MPNMTLPKTRKLAARAEFDRVFAGPDFRFRKHSFLVLAVYSDQPHARLGLVVGKRHARRAVDRNRIRRHIRETFRTRPELPCCDVVVMARAGADQLSPAELNQVLNTLWRRLASAAGNRASDAADHTTVAGSAAPANGSTQPC